MRTKSICLFLVFSFAFLLNSQAKVWRVNNIPGVNANFDNLNDAVNSSSVVNGDTIYVEGSPYNYAGCTLSKRITIIGTGYFLTGTDGNTGLQANANPANLGGAYIVYDSLGSGSTLIGLYNFFMGAGFAGGSAADNITITRCNFNGIGGYYGYAANTVNSGWKINKCYINGAVGSGAFVYKNWDIRNNLMNGIEFQNPQNSDNIIRNNVTRQAQNLYGCYFANNIIGNAGFNVVNTVVKNNLAIGAPAGFTPFVGTFDNSNGHTDANIFQGATGNSLDGQWRLKAGSAAIGAGLTVGTVTSPDCGAFGGPDPYRLSGIANIPTIYTLTVPATIPAGTNTMNVTFSTRNNN